MARTPSFKRVAQQVRMVEKVLLRWPCRPRSRHHSSSSEDLCEEDETNNNQAEVLKGTQPVVDALSSGTPASQSLAQNFVLDFESKGSSLRGDSANSLSPKTLDTQIPDSERTNPSPDTNLHSLNSSHHAAPNRDVNLNEKKHVAPNTTDSPGREGGGQTEGRGKESSKVVESRQVPPAPQSKPECCADRAGVVHVEGVCPAQGKEAVAVAATKEGKGESPAERRRWCPCVLL